MVLGYLEAVVGHPTKVLKRLLLSGRGPMSKNTFMTPLWPDSKSFFDWIIQTLGRTFKCVSIFLREARGSTARGVERADITRVK